MKPGSQGETAILVHSSQLSLSHIDSMASNSCKQSHSRPLPSKASPKSQIISTSKPSNQKPLKEIHNPQSPKWVASAPESVKTHSHHLPQTNPHHHLTNPVKPKEPNNPNSSQTLQNPQSLPLLFPIHPPLPTLAQSSENPCQMCPPCTL